MEGAVSLFHGEAFVAVGWDAENVISHYLVWIAQTEDIFDGHLLHLMSVHVADLS